MVKISSKCVVAFLWTRLETGRQGEGELSFTCTKLFGRIDSTEGLSHLSIVDTEVCRSQEFIRLLL